MNAPEGSQCFHFFPSLDSFPVLTRISSDNTGSGLWYMHIIIRYAILECHNFCFPRPLHLQQKARSNLAG